MGKCLSTIALVSGLWTGFEYLLRTLVFSAVEMKPGVHWAPLEKLIINFPYAGTVLLATIFVLAYAAFVRKKSLTAGLAYGLVLGLTIGIFYVFISFANATPTLTTAAIRLLAYICQSTIAGLLTALIFTPHREKEKPRHILEEI